MSTTTSTSPAVTKGNLSDEDFLRVKRVLGWYKGYRKKYPPYLGITACRDERQSYSQKLLEAFALLDELGANQKDWDALFPPVEESLRICMAFSDLDELPLALAVCLGRWKCRIHLSQLKYLTPGIAGHLAKVNNELFLQGVMAISDQTAEILGGHKGTLSLGLTDLSETVARNLSRHQGELNLPRLEWISQEAAIQLSGFTFDLGLHCLKKIHPDVSGHFVGMRNVHFPYIIADKIALMEANLSMEERDDIAAGLYEDIQANIQSVCDQLIEKNAEYGDWFLVFGGTRSELFFKDWVLRLPGLRRIPLQVARFLFAGYIEEAYMDDLESIDAKVLGCFNMELFYDGSVLSMKGVKSIDDASAEILSDCEGEIRLGYPKMSEYALKLLKGKNVVYFGSEEWELELDGGAVV